MKKYFFLLLLLAASSYLLFIFQIKRESPSTTTVPLPSTIGQVQKNEWIDLDEKWQMMNYQTTQNQQNYRISVYKAPLDKIEASLYYRSDPMTLQAWKNALSERIIINGSYFDEMYKPTGEFMLDGISLGSSPYKGSTTATIQFDDRSIHFFIGQESPESNYSLQSYPVLLADGGKEQITEDSGKLARRTVIGQTKDNDLIIFLVDETPISLYLLMKLLRDELFNLDLAINLDGGQSSGIIYETSEKSEYILPIVALPIVIGLD